MTTFTTSSTRYTKRAARHRRGGFTVLEVLIALVVLLIGGLAIMNLFPPALNVIRGSENREVAMAQAKGTLAKYNADPATIPDAIYDNSTGGIWTDSGAVAPEGTRNRNFSLPKTTAPSPTAATDYDGSALGHFKHIVGERHRVLSSPSGKFVLLRYAYLGMPVVTTADSVESVQVSSNGVLDFSGATKSSDGTDFRSPVLGSYYVSYSWQNAASGPLQSVIDEPVLYVPSPGNMQVFQGAQGKAIVVGPISVKVFLPSGSVAPAGDAPVRGFLPVSSTLTAGQEVSVEYNVLDWRWLVEDASATVPTIKKNPPLSGVAPITARDIKLSIQFLGTPTVASAAPSGRSLYALTMPAPDASGTILVDPRVGEWTGAAGGIGTDVVLDVNSSSATYDIAESAGSAKPAMVAPRVRTSYWATHGWAQQLSVAARSYYPFDAARVSPAFAREPWREYAWSPNTSTIYFRPCEAGKTVLVSFAYLNGGTPTPVGNQIVTISAKPRPSAVLPGSTQVAEATLLDPKSTSGATASAVAITSVRGASVRARSAWIQNGNYTQEVAEMYRPLN